MRPGDRTPGFLALCRQLRQLLQVDLALGVDDADTGLSSAIMSKTSCGSKPMSASTNSRCEASVLSYQRVRR